MSGRIKLNKGSEKMTKILKTVFILSGSVLLLNALHMAIIANLNAGIVPVILLGVMLLCYGIFFGKLKSRKPINAFVAVILTTVLFFGSFLVYYGKHDNADYTEKTVIVLGCGINGEEVSVVLAKRLDKAIEYIGKNTEAQVIVSGGQGPQEEVSEAYAMKKYLVSKGVDENRIIMEDKSTSTITNFRYSHEIMKQKGLPIDSVAFVTSSFHVYRATSYAKAEGLDVTHLGAGITWYTAPLNYMREMMAVVKMWVFD